MKVALIAPVVLMTLVALQQPLPDDREGILWAFVIGQQAVIGILFWQLLAALKNSHELGVKLVALATEFKNAIGDITDSIKAREETQKMQNTLNELLRLAEEPIELPAKPSPRRNNKRSP